MVYMVVEARVVGAVGVRDPPRRPVVDHGALLVVQVVPTWHLSREHECQRKLSSRQPWEHLYLRLALGLVRWLRARRGVRKQHHRDAAQDMLPRWIWRMSGKTTACGKIHKKGASAARGVNVQSTGKYQARWYEYSRRPPQDDGVGRGDIHTYAIVLVVGVGVVRYTT